MSKQDKFRLNAEDMREDKELRLYIASSIAMELCKSLRQDPDGRKAAEAAEASRVGMSIAFLTTTRKS